MRPSGHMEVDGGQAPSSTLQILYKRYVQITLRMLHPQKQGFGSGPQTLVIEGSTPSKEGAFGSLG